MPRLLRPHRICELTFTSSWRAGTHSATTLSPVQLRASQSGSPANHPGPRPSAGCRHLPGAHPETMEPLVSVGRRRGRRPPGTWLTLAWLLPSPLATGRGGAVRGRRGPDQALPRRLRDLSPAAPRPSPHCGPSPTHPAGPGSRAPSSRQSQGPLRLASAAPGPSSAPTAQGSLRAS